MAIIKFSNGTQVNFDGNPTPQDIEEVANKLGINQPATPEKTSEVAQPGFIQSLAQGIAKPFLKTLSAPYTAIKSAVQLAKGDTAGANKTLTEPMNFGYFGKVDPLGKKVDPNASMGKQFGQFNKEIFGTGTEIGSWFIPVGPAAQGLKQLGTGARILRSVGQGAKIGAEAGSLMGFGQALQEDENAFAGAIKGGLGGAVFGGAIGGAGAGFSKIIQPIKQDLTNYIAKAIKPSFSGKIGDIASGKYYDDAIKAFEVIVDNKEAIKLTDELGNLSKKLPENRQELLQAIQDVKTSIFKKYNDLAVGAGKEGATFNAKSIIDDLVKVTEDVSYNPQIRKYANDLISEMSELGGKAPEVIQSRIKDLNESLGGFFAGRVDKAKARLDASVASKLNQSLDELVTRITGEAYRPLRLEYGALKSIEKDVARQVALELRRNQKGLIDFTDIFTGGDILAGVIDPTSLIRGLGGRGIKEVYKYLNNPNRYVKKIFEAIEKQKAKTPKILKPAMPKNPNAGLLEAPKYIPVGGKYSTSDKVNLGSKLYTQEEAIALLKKQGVIRNTELDGIKIYPTKTNQNVEAQRALLERMSPEEKATYMNFKKNVYIDSQEFSEKFLTLERKYGILSSSNIKSDGRAIEKAYNKYNGNFEKITDMNRGYFVTSDFNKTLNLLDDIKKDYNVIKIENRLEDPTLGYRDITVKVKLANGTTGEIQIIPANMARAKKANHILYEESRVIKEARAVRDLTSEERIKLYELSKKQDANYSEAWSKDSKNYIPVKQNFVGLDKNRSAVYNINANANKSILKDLATKANEGGFTFNIKGNSDLAGKSVYSVSIYPERSKIFDGKVTPTDIYKFIRNNQDLLKKPENSIGGWLDESTGQLYLDVVVTPAGLGRAKILGEEFNQKAIYDLGKGQEVPTGGTGENVGQFGSVYERGKKVKKLLND